MNEESGGFGSGAVQMKALPSAAPAGAVAASTTEKDGKINQNPDSNASAAGEFDGECPSRDFYGPHIPDR